MKLVQLLTGAGVAALLAGAASAQVITPTGAFDAAEYTASEFNGAVTGTVTLDHGTGSGNTPFAGIGAGGALVQTITFTNLQFSSVLPSTIGDDDGTQPVCDMNLTGGGGSGGSVFQLTSSGAINACDLSAGNVMDWDVPLTRIAPGANATVEIVNSCSGPALDCAGFTNFTETYTILREVDAYEGGSIAAVTVATIDADGVGPATPFNIGDVSYSFRTSADPDGAGPLGTANINTDTGTIIVTGAAITSAEANINFPLGTAGIASADISTTSGNITCTLDAPNNQFDCPLTAAQLEAFAGTAADGRVTFTPDNANPILEQTPTVSVTVTDAANYDAPDVAALTLGAIERDDGVQVATPTGPAGGANVNLFPWTNLRSTGGTQSNFRITGLASDLAQDSDECVLVALSATSGALPAAYTAPVCLAGADVTVAADATAANTWTAIFNSTAIASALGVTTEGVNGNVSIQVRVNDAAQADTQTNSQIDRLLIKNGNVTGTAFDN